MEPRLAILIVDDAQTNRMILRHIFEDSYTIYEADNGAAALEILQKKVQVDIILLDIIMPVMNGIEFMEIVREDADLAKIPIIVNTTEDAKENEIQVLDLGADDFITKPYNPQIVRRRVDNVIEKYVLQRRQMEDEIRDSSERFEMIVDTVPGGIGIFEYTDIMHNIYFSDGFCGLLGYEKSELKELAKGDALDFIYEEDRELIADRAGRHKFENGVYHNSVRMYRKDGSLIWIAISARKLMNRDGRYMYYAVFSDMTEEKKNQEQMRRTMNEMRYRAERDLLTGIYNRDTFYKQTERLIKQNPDVQYVLGMWNIDRFKVVNELFGSKTGDSVLMRLATFLEQLVGEHGVYGRFEADHFAICVPKDYLDTEMSELEKALTNGIQGDGLNYTVMAHVGLYKIHNLSMSIDLMCDRANLALQTVKGNYMRHFAYYDDSLKERMMVEQELVNEMETALEEHQFFINLQPIVSAKTKELVSAEALVRWKHPVKGVISPGIFIPLFEKNGFIAKLDLYVWEEVCRFLAENRDQAIGNVPVSVNVSRINSYNPELFHVIMGLIEKYGLTPENLKIEITESAYTENPFQRLSTMDVFQTNGFKVLMDDFGSGYSSLNMLKEVPVDILKIDMAFIDDIETSERACNILYNIIRMAKSLNMEIVAEGVETQNQYEMLKSMGCDNIQGYYFSRPLMTDDFRKLLVDKMDHKNGLAHSDERKTILVIDDMEINRAAIEATLCDDYQVIQAEDGVAGMEVIKNLFAEINLIITDIMMPRMNGFELLEAINSNSLYSHIPVIVLTGLDEMENEVRALELGAVDVTIKPFEPRILLKRVGNLIAASEKETIYEEVQALRENIAFRKQFQTLLDRDVAGIARFKISIGDELILEDVAFANDRFYSLHRLMSDEIRPNSRMGDYLYSVEEDDRNRILGGLMQAVQAQHKDIQARYMITQLDGNRREVILNARFTYETDGIYIDIVEFVLEPLQE